jgi:hypothetical protein
MKPFRPLLAMILAIIVLMLASAHVSAQTAEQTSQLQHCLDLKQQVNAAIEKFSLQTLISVSQTRMTQCSEIMGPTEKAETLGYIGFGLNELKRNLEAIPVLKRCVSLYPSDATCWFFLGNAFQDPQ